MGLEPIAQPLSESAKRQMLESNQRVVRHLLLVSLNWYPESDSNRHDSPFERDASYQLGYRGINSYRNALARIELAHPT
jgi:hypothetical protein